MAFADEKDGERRRKSEDGADSEATERPQPKRKRGAAPEFGSALRSVYQQTVNEDIPPDMLDLLGKLG